MQARERITLEQARHVAGLARLDLEAEELERLTRQLDAILDYVAELDALDTDGVEPTTHVVPLTCPEREDRAPAGDAALARAILQAAPEQDGEHFVVPRILD